MAGGVFYFYNMQNYIYNRLREHKQRIADAIINQINTAYANKGNPLNSYHGTVTGKGTVESSFILGDVQVAEGSQVIGCKIDKGVTLIVEEGARVIGGSFHAYYGSNEHATYPVTVRIGKNVQIAGMWTGEDVTVGDNSVLFWVQIHGCRQDYEAATKTDGVVIGKDCVIYRSYIRSESPTNDAGLKCKITLGDGAFMWEGRLTASEGSIQVGNDAVLCSYANACKILFKGMAPTMLNQDFSQIPDYIGNVSMFAGIGCLRNNVVIGDKFYVMANTSLQKAYDKLKDPYIKFGDSVSICDTDRRERGESTPNLSVHRMEVGDNVTLAFTGDGWYRGNMPYRQITIGRNTTVRMCPHRGDNTYMGTETRIPANAVALL